MFVELRQFLVERKRTIAAHGHHADELSAAKADQVCVFGVEFVDEPRRGRGLVLRDFFDKRFVIELMDLLELRFFRCDFELERGPVVGVHDLVDSALAARSTSRWRARVG